METTHESSKQTLCSAQPAKPYAFSRKVFCEGMRDGVPIALGYFAVSFSLGIAARTAGFTPLQGFVASLLNNASAVYGDPAIAAFAIVSRCLNFVNSTVVGFGQGFQPVCGFNYGARKYDRMHRAFSFSVKVTTIVLLVLGAAGFAFAEPVVTLFRRSDPEVIRIGTETFRVQILTVWAWGFITLSNMYTQAIGYGIRSTILAAARQGLFLIPTLLVLPNVWGLRGLEVCQPLADVLTLALAVWMMTKVIRAQKAQMAQETA